MRPSIAALFLAVIALGGRSVLAYTDFDEAGLDARELDYSEELDARAPDTFADFELDARYADLEGYPLDARFFDEEDDSLDARFLDFEDDTLDARFADFDDEELEARFGDFGDEELDARGGVPPGTVGALKRIGKGIGRGIWRSAFGRDVEETEA